MLGGIENGGTQFNANLLILEAFGVLHYGIRPTHGLCTIDSAVSGQVLLLFLGS